MLRKRDVVYELFVPKEACLITMVYDYMTGALEAVLFAAGEPLSVAELAAILQLDKPQVWNLLNNLENAYAEENRGLMIREVAGGYQLVTKPSYYNLLTNLSQTKTVKLSNAAMETLAIVAFKQPVTRSEMEEIRGVKVDGVVNTLLDLGIITEAGRKKAPGNPLLYATTDKFLAVFGMNSLDDLPKVDFDSALEQMQTEKPEQQLLDLPE